MGERVFRLLSRERRTLPVKLKDDEWDAKAKRLADISDEIQSVDSEVERIKSTIKEIKARKESLAAEAKQVARVVRTGCEDREVDVMIEVEEATKTVYERREDTNEVIRERGLTAQEAQVAMFGPEQPQPGDDAKDVTPKALPAKRGRRTSKPVDIEDLDEPDEEEEDDEDDDLEDDE